MQFQLWKCKYVENVNIVRFGLSIDEDAVVLDVRCLWLQLFSVPDTPPAM